MAEVLFKVESLNFSWKPGFPLLENIYLEADRGETVGIVGRNGSGKSTLFECLTTLEAPASSLFIDGKWLDFRQRHRHIALLSQDSFLPRQLKVGVLLKAFCQRLDPWKDEVIMQVLQPVLDLKAGLLSGGERRLLEFLLVLGMDQEVLILDEPFSELSPLLSRHMARLLTQHQGSRAVLLTDHDWPTVKEVSTRLLMLREKELVPVSGDQALKTWGYLQSGPDPARA